MSRYATDLLRSLAACFIIYNHVSWNIYSLTIHDHAPWWVWLTAAGNQFGKAAVLFFIFLSGYAFAHHPFFSQAGAWPFLKNRFSRILPPYLLACIGAALHHGVALELWPRKFIDGSVMYHLYFIPLILCCYLLYPLLRRIPQNRLTVSLSGLVLLGGIVFLSGMTGRPLLGPVVYSWPGDWQNFYGRHHELFRWIEYWLYAPVFFLAGLWWGRRPPAWVKKPPLWLLYTGVALATALVWYDFNLRLDRGLSADSSGRIWRLSVVIQAAAWVLLFSRFTTQQPGLFLRRAARASFLVYLVHPFYLYAVRVVTMPFVVELLLVAVASWATAALMENLTTRHNVFAWMFGEGDRLVKKADRVR